MAGGVCARGAGDELDEQKEKEVGEVHRCEFHSNIHTRVPIPKPEATRYGSETPNEETTPLDHGCDEDRSRIMAKTRVAVSL